MISRFKFLLLMLIIPVVMNAQSVPDLMLGKIFSTQVKSIDEFIQRFNGDESSEDVTDSVQGRLHNLIALFDYHTLRESMPDTVVKQKVLNFIDCVEQSNAKIRLTDADMYAEVKTQAIVLGKNVDLSLILQSQNYGNNQTRWAIIGTKGLADANIIDTVRFYGINPVEHEIHFMGLEDIFEKDNNSHLIGYRGKDTSVDELSVLFALGMTDNVRISEIEKLTMHCLEVPGYVFTIDEHNNLGWCISGFMKLENKEKYINKLFGK